jgi:exosortase
MKLIINQTLSKYFSSHLAFWGKTIIVLTLWCVTFLPVYPELWHTWINDSNNSHGILVPLISVVLIWGNRDKLSKADNKNSNFGAAILVVSLVLYITSLAGDSAVVQRAMIVFSLISLVLYNFGTTVFRILAFPLFYLFFMIPLPVSINSLIALPLQLFATKISHAIIQAVNIPVLQEGNMLYFAQTQLEVAEACSGIRSMMSFVMLSVLFAYLMDKGWWRKCIIVISAIPLAIVTNIIRVTGTGILAHFFGQQVARGFLHEFSGLAVFIVGFVLLFSEYSLLNRISAKKHNSY